MKNEKALARAIILDAASRFMADMNKRMTTKDVLSTAKEWADWAEGD